jgi:signal recognition particle receptor subunit beta
VKELPARLGWSAVLRFVHAISSLRMAVCTANPKVVLAGLIQTGKSRLFQQMTGIDMREFKPNQDPHTRFPLRAQSDLSVDAPGPSFSTDPPLLVDMVDFPGVDDGVELGMTFLTSVSTRAAAVIVVIKYNAIDSVHNRQMLEALMSKTSCKVLIVINQVDEFLKNELNNEQQRLQQGQQGIVL